MGKFFLTGSSTPLAGVNTHSGAGRILSLRMRPLALFERPGVEPTVHLRELFHNQPTIHGESEFALADYYDDKLFHHSGYGHSSTGDEAGEGDYCPLP